MDRRSLVMVAAGIWGLITLAAIYVGVDRIERDLTTRTRAALATAGLGWASVSYSGRDAFLQGVAPSDDARAQARRLVESLPGVHVVRDHGVAQ
jgi:osmotically-inducible protein OsmY